ncbi:unnamed protein product [Oppiella nova]|uniref:SGNH hydrolase-type esterase domain-containing protein n=1 Tax=Oppiella nova TaxID=334625 RepID=A0A7R9L7E3_9ACAR|nr:unnamed protein product [Oppiella nova]CAG2156863.1 unnamed protein product [Oppiella nova]
MSIICLLPVSSFAKTIMILGDSLSAGYGINPQQGWVFLLQQRLNQQFPKQHNVVNASVSGETTSGALARFPKLLQSHKPDIVVIELGGNDGLRGQPPQMIQKNLAQLIQQSQKSQATNPMQHGCNHNFNNQLIVDACFIPLLGTLLNNV